MGNTNDPCSLKLFHVCATVHGRCCSGESRLNDFFLARLFGESLPGHFLLRDWRGAHGSTLSIVCIKILVKIPCSRRGREWKKRGTLWKSFKCNALLRLRLLALSLGRTLIILFSCFFIDRIGVIGALNYLGHPEANVLCRRRTHPACTEYFDSHKQWSRDKTMGGDI